MAQPPRTGPVRHETGTWPHFLDPLRHLGTHIAHLFSPSADASRDDEGYEITLELPGVKSKDLDVTIDDHVLTIRGEKRSERKEEGKTYFVAERRYGAFHRAFQLPTDVDESNIDAMFEDGVLTLKLAKQRSAKERERKIEIRTK